MIILISMTLHCASRLGVVSYLYEHRHQIAYRLGVLAEIPISLCSGEYFAMDISLCLVEAYSNDEEPAHANTPSAHEITLFLQEQAASVLEPYYVLLDRRTTGASESWYRRPLTTIFHPPC